jgi:hypothetical protein
MEFYINFNRGDNDKLLEKLGAVHKKSQDHESLGYFIEIEDFAQLAEFEDEVERIIGDNYSLIIGFNPATIYLDDV